MARRFNVRVYGLLIMNGSVLVTRETIKGSTVTKFPGGGLEFGEGLAECLVREFGEELGTAVRIRSHFYTTDFFVASAFDPDSQVISVYYLVEPVTNAALAVTELARKEGIQNIEWLPIDSLTESHLSLVIDKKVAVMLKQQFAKGTLC